MSHRIITILIVLLMLPVSLVAQQRNDSKQPSRQERETWMKEMQQVKTDFIARQLCLSEEKKEKFVHIYSRMDNELRAANEQAMKLTRNLRRKGETVSDAEKEKAAMAQFELKSKEGAIEMKYYKEFRTLLSPDQMLKLKHAEREFSRELMNRHRNNKAPGKHKAQQGPQSKSQKKD